MKNKDYYESIFLNLGINIDNFDEFVKYVEIFSLKKIIFDYSSPFIDNKNDKFDPSTKSSEIINFIKFDRLLSLNILDLILFLESKLKNIIIREWTNFYFLNDTKIYNFSDEFLNSLIPNLKELTDLNFVDFKYSLFEYATSSEYLLEYDSLKDVPIEDLSNTWTFATIINFFRSLNEEIKEKVIKEFKIDSLYINDFQKMLNVILKVRNMISHNYTIYNLSIKYYRYEFNKIYNAIFYDDQYNQNSSICFIQLFKILKYLLLIDLDYDEISLIKKIDIDSKFKEKILNFLFGKQ